MRKIFIIAGEASGDLHGANLVKSLLELDPTLEIRAYGGSKMQSAGAEVVRSYEAYAFMGFYEVLKNAAKVLKNLKETSRIINQYQPDILIFIDFPSFNLRVAQRLRSKLPNTKFCYYISPKVWAWKSGRVHKIDRLMDEVLVIFPFEKEFYGRYGYDVTYVGNPLLDEIETKKSKNKDPRLVAVLPGSRRQEIEMMLPIFAELSALMPKLRFEVSTMPQFDLSFYEKCASGAGDNLIFSSRTTYELLDQASAALVTSGTATLETALFDTPQIVAYKTSRLSYEIGKRVIKTKYISLVNLILDRPAVKEVIQDELTALNLEIILEDLISDHSQMLIDYRQLRNILGKVGASKRTAKLILQSKTA